MEQGAPSKAERRLRAVQPLLILSAPVLLIAGIASVRTAWLSVVLIGTGILLVTVGVWAIPRYLRRSGGEARLLADDERRRVEHVDAFTRQLRKTAEDFGNTSVEVWDGEWATHILLKSGDPNTAEVEILVLSENEVRASFPWGNTGEAFDSKMSSFDWLNEYRPLVDAVTGGRVRCSTWHLDGIEIGSEITLSDEEGKVIQRFASGDRGKRRAVRSDLSYAPYRRSASQPAD